MAFKYWTLVLAWVAKHHDALVGSFMEFYAKYKIQVAIMSLAFLLILFFSWQAFAYNATVSWTNPTTNTDSTAIPASGPGSLVSTRIEWGTCGAGGTFGIKASEVVVNQPAVSVVIPGFVAGQVACFQAFAKNTFLAESAASLVVAKVFPVPVPNPPTLASTITVAYDLRMNSSGGILLGRVVGDMPLGTACTNTQVDIKGRAPVFYKIRMANVHITRTPRSSIIVTKCALV